MHNFKETGILKILSVFSMSISIFMGIELYSLKNETAVENIKAQKTKEYTHVVPPHVNIHPVFSSAVESLFPKVLKPVEVKKTIHLEKGIIIPELTFIGMVETAEKRIYSFKDLDTGNLLFLEKGVNIKGLTLVNCADNTCTIKINDTTFQVEMN